MKLKQVIPYLLVILVLSCTSTKKVVKTPLHPSISSLEKNFSTPPDSIQTSIYWYWMSDNISKEGVVKDLQAMKRVGINRAFIGNIGYPTTPYGKVKIFTAEWWEILHTALKTATELDIEIGIFNSPGWSQSGGPWIKPEQSMRYLTSSSTTVKGNQDIKVQLLKPHSIFQDVRVIAFPAPKDYKLKIADLKPKVTASINIQNLNHLVDQDTIKDVIIPGKAPIQIDFEVNTDFTARSLIIYPAHFEMTGEAELQVKENNTYRSISTFTIDRNRNSLNVGFKPYGAVAISIPATTAKNFRLIIKNKSENFGIAEVEISASPQIESYIEKTLAKMFQSPLPYWNEYQWRTQPSVDDQSLMINPKTVLDISKYMDKDGFLNWSVPAGNWVIMRTGMTTTGVTNGPASAEATGLEVDKMSKEHVQKHFDAFLGEIMRRIPAQDRKTWKVTVQDSYETGGQNWTDDLIEKFSRHYGYDPLPYLPTLTGSVVGSPEMSDRFLWDLRRFVADRVAYDYVGGLREISHKYGLHTWLENYGHWGFPGEFLQYGGQSDEIGGEFWSEGELGNIENRAASSAAHIYGKNKVSAESFTAGGKAYVRYPAYIKQRGDRFFTEGINNTLLHVFISQPSDDKIPGINANFSTEFNRHNTWFNYLDLFTTYLKRTNYLLQQGKYVADVAYFIGEDAPKMTGICDPALPFGYAFDYINGEVLHQRATVKNGRIYLPDGMNYSLLVLPKLETIRPELLKKISELVAEGAIILGPKPLKSPSLANYPDADVQIKKLADALWGNINGTTIKSHAFGKGMVLSNMDMQSALDTIKIKADFALKQNVPVLFIHRSTADGELYFISNQSDKLINFDASFKVNGKQPELWDPVTGTIRSLNQFTQIDGATNIPLQLDVLQSAFILFRKPIGERNYTINYPMPLSKMEINTPWTVTFDAKMRGPEQPVVFNELIDWTQHNNDQIKYYSGTAIYRNTINITTVNQNEHYYLNLGDVKVMAKVKINGVDVGGAWTAPWRVDISKAIQKGVNQIEISVVNTWVNRLIGDSKLPENERKTWTNDNPYRPSSKLELSGLKGPVNITSIKY